MKPEVFDQSKNAVLKAAYYYYMLDMPQKLIAKKMNISVATVSRFLTKAREEEIIRIVFPEQFAETIQLEEQMVQRFGLQEVVVVQSASNVDFGTEHPDEFIKREVALEAARYIQRVITPDDVLGIAWGTTMFHMINYLNPCRKVNADFITLHGSIANYSDELDVRTLVSRMAMAFGGKNYPLLTESLMSSREVAESIRNERNVRSVFEMFPRVTMSINGAGSIYPQHDSFLTSPLYLNEKELNEIDQKGAYGDVVLRFIDQNGQECDTELRDRTIAIDLEVFRKIPRKIMIASGERKAHTMLAALRGKLIDVFIADDQLVRKILSL